MLFQEKKQGKLCVFTGLVGSWGETLGIGKKQLGNGLKRMPFHQILRKDTPMWNCDTKVLGNYR
jgi:hypothetical protein